ncbi:MAG: hypothetical protein KAT15_22950, partial [Bacteroidales bacterium]|nr:hypothetical protein [Bacteroidales bacterium]
IFKFFNENPGLAIISSVAALILLMVFVKLGSKLSARKLMLEELIKINEEEIRVLDWKYDFFNPGSEHTDPGHPNTSDLDIFGENSLFQYLNRTSISKGSDQLASWLNTPSKKDEITRRQASVKELCTKLDWRQEFLATGRLSEETSQDYTQMLDWLNEKPYFSVSKLYSSLLIYLPLLTILSLVLSFRWIPYNIPVFMVLIQLALVGAKLRQINHHHNQISRKFKLLNNYSNLIRMVEEEEFTTEYLHDLKKDLSASGIKAGQQLRSLARLVVQFDRRLNMIMGIVLNGLLMWDLQCILRLERWKTSNVGAVPGWFKILGEFEALNSLANFEFNNPGTVFPKISHEGVIIEAKSLGHPLIPQKESILNDIKISQPGEFMLITGSNMAGKSTFLRTVGVNMVLAGAGAPVLALNMQWRPVRIFTSMRVRDSLSSRESTFYAELKRLRKIIDVHKNGEKVLVILDEILKGTNSRDKHFGSEMFIRQLVRDESAGLIATHDLELSKLEEEFPDKILNYCFEVQIDNQEFIYDYKLRKGVCRTLNATDLMRKMGISIEKTDTSR